MVFGPVTDCVSMNQIHQIFSSIQAFFWNSAFNRKWGDLPSYVLKLPKLCTKQKHSKSWWKNTGKMLLVSMLHNLKWKFSTASGLSGHPVNKECSLGVFLKSMVVKCNNIWIKMFRMQFVFNLILYC